MTTSTPPRDREAPRTVADSGLALLVVEDSPTDALLIGDMLSVVDAVASVTVVPRLGEALEVLPHQRFDLVLLDLNLPDSEGLDTFSRLTADCPVAVLVLTGLDDEDMGARAVRLGAQDYLVKARLQPQWLGRSILYAVERHRLLDLAVRSREELRALARRVVDVREEERTRLSREVHDRLGQNLSAFKMDLRWMARRLEGPGEAQTPALLAKVAAALEVVDDSIQCVQDVALALRPGVLDALGLSAALLDEARRFMDRTGTPCRVDIATPAPTVTGDEATALFRIFQELLTNVIRHAQATQVVCSLKQDADRVRLTVADDGVGLHHAAGRKHALGLLGISERASAFGGAARFETASGGGTTATIDIPWPRQR